MHMEDESEKKIMSIKKGGVKRELKPFLKEDEMIAELIEKILLRRITERKILEINKWKKNVFWRYKSQIKEIKKKKEIL